MVAIERKSKAYGILRMYVDAVTKASFRHLKVEGMEQLPEDGAVIFAPNHCCTLMDPLVILQCDKGPSAYGARADIFRKPKVANILRWLRIVPLARVRDGLEMVKQNQATFEEIVTCLASGIPFCIFGEGTHHPGYTVYPMRTGVFRIADMTRERTKGKVWIVPVGLSYNDFFHYRNDVTVRFGSPIDADEILPLSPRERSEQLTAKVQELVVNPSSRKWIRTREENRQDRSEELARLILKLVILPFFLSFMMLSLPEWVTSELICRKLKDKAWSNTVRYVCNLLMLPLMVMLNTVLGFTLLTWHRALLLVVMTVIAPFFFYDFLRFYSGR